MKVNYKIMGMAVLLCGIISCNNSTTDKTETTAPIEVQVTTVQKKDLKEYLTFNGVTKYQKREDIRAAVTGYVSWMPFERGDPIKKGQAFASIRTKEQDALNEAAKIDSSLAKFSKPLTVTSHATGILSKLKVVPNDYVAEGDVMATVSQPNTLVVQVSVPYEYNEKVHKGTSCSIIINGSREINASITSELTSIDSLGQAQHYLINLPNANLPENLNVQVRIVSKEAKNALSIPQQALQTNELITKFWVMKLVNDTLAVKREVTPMLQTDSLVQIQSDDVKLNDKIVTEGSYQMQDSTRVSIKKQ